MRVLILGDTGGVGAALAKAARERGDTVVGLSRSRDGLDITDETRIQAALEPLQDDFDAILVATGALEIDGIGPEKALSALTPDAALAQFRLNALGPALVLKHAKRLLPRDRRAVFAAFSARVGSIGDNRAGGWYSYRASKAALNQFLHTAAIDLARSHPQLIVTALHPGTVQTDLTRKYLGRHPSVPPAEAAGNLWRVIDALDVTDTGGFKDWAGKDIPW